MSVRAGGGGTPITSELGWNGGGGGGGMMEGFIARSKPYLFFFCTNTLGVECSLRYASKILRGICHMP